MLPNPIAVALIANAEVAALSCSTKVFDDEFALAVNAAVCAELTHVTFAVKDAEDEPGATVTVAGAVTALLLLDTEIACPPVGAVELKDTVQLSDPEPVNEPLLHTRALTVGAATVPVPLRATEAVRALLAIVS